MMQKMVRTAMLAAGLIGWAAAPEALDLDVGVNATLGMGGAESYIAVGYGTAALGYGEPGVSLSGTASGWYLAFGSWLSPYFALDARLGATNAAGLGALGGQELSVRLPSWYGLYLRPQWTGEMVAVHALVGFSEFQYERTVLDPAQGTAFVDATARTAFSFGAGIALAPAVGLELGAEWLALARNTGLGPAVSGSASLLAGYLLFSF